MPSVTTVPCRLLAGLLTIAGISPVALAGDTVPAGRYLDVSVRVESPEQLNPLSMVGDLHFSDRVTVGEAVRTALAGTGYRLAESAWPSVRALLDSRVAIAHAHFERKRIDSVIAALVGVGRGYDVEVDHVARMIRIVATISQSPPHEDRGAAAVPPAPFPGNRDS